MGRSTDPAAVRQLVAMGFGHEEATLALVEVGGDDVEAASALLCGEGRSNAAVGAADMLRIEPGAMVEIHSCKPEDGPALNGTKGIVKMFDTDRGGYIVEVGTEHRFFMRPENLRVLKDVPPPSPS